MQGLIMAAQLILALTILVGIHEFGHYIAARMFGVRVDKFFIFFDAWGKKLFSFKKGDTEYGIGWLPLGGYVKIAGMIDESMDKSYQDREPQEWEFRSKPAWQKLIIMLAGIFLNIVLGVFIFATINFTNKQFISIQSMGSNYEVTAYGKSIGLQTGDSIVGANGNTYNRLQDINYNVAFGGNLDVNRNGETIQLPVPKDHFKSGQPFITLYGDVSIKKIVEDSPAEQAGMQEGDTFQSINGTAIKSYPQFISMLQENKGETILVSILRNNKEELKSITVTDDGKLGFLPSVTISKVYKLGSISLKNSIAYGWKDAFNIVFLNAKAFVKIGKGEIKAKESLGGPIKIATMFGPTWDWGRFWNITGALSMVLAFMNILPIPALDGGHAVFAIYEMIMRKPVNEKFLEIAQLTGFIILMALMVFIFWNDISNLL